jgi:hypothetical protein
LIAVNVQQRRLTGATDGGSLIDIQGVDDGQGIDRSGLAVTIGIPRLPHIVSNQIAARISVEQRAGL